MSKQASKTVQIRPAREEDAGLIFQLIREIADYEKMSGEVTATEDRIRREIFERGAANVLIAEEGGIPAGFALYFFHFSTFLGKQGLYLEDVFVRPAFRGKGYGYQLLKELAGIAAKRGCERMEWSCLNWNQSAVSFYRGLGAQPMDEWTTFRLSGEALRRLSTTEPDYAEAGENNGSAESEN